MIARGGSIAPPEQLVRQIPGALQLDEPTVLTTLGELTAQGLVATPPGVSTRLTLTTDGDAQFHHLRQSVASVTARLVGDLAADELATTRRVLGIVTERANAELGQPGGSQTVPHRQPIQ